MSSHANVPFGRSVLAIVLAIVTLAWLGGLVRFVGASGRPEVILPRTASPPSGEHNLAHFRYGPTLRASSYFRDPVSQHHPSFVVDGRDRPSLIEKWASRQDDAAPFIEIIWREPRRLERVVIRHGGSAEDPGTTLDRYRLACLGSDGAASLPLTIENRDHVASHALPCEGAHGIRLEARPGNGGMVRIYEIEAYGQ